MGKSIVVGEEVINLINAPVAGDVAVTHDGVSTIGDGKVTADMLSTALKQFLFPVAVVGETKVGYCTIG